MLRFKNDYDKSSTFFTEFEKLINELKSAGATVTQREKLNYMLRTLPDSLNYVGDLIDTLKEVDQTCEFLKNKIIMWEAREKENNCQNHSRKSALKSERKELECKEPEKICFGCGNPGHIKANCRNTWSRKVSRRKNACGGTYEQGGAHQSYQQRDRGRSTYEGGRGRLQRGKGDRGHDTNYENTGSFNAEVVTEIRNSQVEVNVSQNGKVEWILDSECIDHIINNESYFTNYVCLTNLINVKIGDGRSVQATTVGNIQTYFLTYRKRINIKISNVFYVREMDRNLLSYAKVTVKNKIVSKDNTSKIYKVYNKLITIAFKENGLYKIRGYIINKDSNVIINQRLTGKEKFHRILGHSRAQDIVCNF